MFEEFRRLVAKKFYIQRQLTGDADSFRKILDENNVWYEHGFDNGKGHWFKIFGQTKELLRNDERS